MAKTSGLGSGLLVGTVDVSGDIGSISVIETSRALLDVTGIDKSAVEKILGRKDGKITFMAFWNTAVGAAHATLSALPRTDVQVTYIHGSTVGEAASSQVSKQLNYAPKLGTDGSLTADIEAIASGYGNEWGELLTTGAQAFASGTVSGAAIDLVTTYGTAFGTATSFGAAAYLHVLSVGSGTATVTVQDSADGTTYTAVAGMAFTAASAAGVQRLQGATNATIREYVRAQVTGTYTALSAAVNFVRYFETP